MPEAPAEISVRPDVRRRNTTLTILVCYWLLWVTVTHWPKIDLPSLSTIRIDKFVHFSGYLVLAVLLFFAWPFGPKNVGAFRPRTALAVMTIIAVGGILDELTQPYFGRTFEWGDYIADLCGALAGLAIAAAFVFFRATKRLSR